MALVCVCDRDTLLRTSEERVCNAPSKSNNLII
jgi:hypothetical protein